MFEFNPVSDELKRFESLQNACGNTLFTKGNLYSLRDAKRSLL